MKIAKNCNPIKPQKIIEDGWVYANQITYDYIHSMFNIDLNKLIWIRLPKTKDAYISNAGIIKTHNNRLYIGRVKSAFYFYRLRSPRNLIYDTKRY